MAVWSPASRIFLRWSSSRLSRSLAIGCLFSAAIVLILVAMFGVPVRGTISSAEIHLIAGKAFSYTLPANPLSSMFKLDGDNLQAPDRSTLRVLEDGRQLGPAHTLHADIQALGGGRFSHWGDQLVFSTSDGSSPKTNARVYTYAGRAYLSSDYLKIALLAAAAAFLSSIWLGRNSFRSLMNVITRSYLISHWKTTFIILLVCLNFMLIALYVFAPDAHWSVRPESIKAGEGHAYISMTAPTFAWPYESGRDSNTGLVRSNARLYEDGRPLGPSHSLHSMVRDVGRGMHSFWSNMLVFSTSDNSDPRTNGRRYTVIEHAVVNEQLIDAVILVDLILMLSLVWFCIRGIGGFGIWLCAILVLTLVPYLCVLWSIAPHAALVVLDDARHFVVYLRRMMDPELYPRDITADFFGAVTPWLYRVLYWPLASLGVDPIQAHLYLVMPFTGLLFACASYVFIYHFWPSGLGAAVASLVLINILGWPNGLPHDFGYTFVLLVTLAFVSRRVLASAAAMVGATGLLPVTGLISGLTMSFLMLSRRAPYVSRNPKDWAALFAAVIAFLAGAYVAISFAATTGPTFTASEARSMPYLSNVRRVSPLLGAHLREHLRM